MKWKAFGIVAAAALADPFAALADNPALHRRQHDHDDGRQACERAVVRGFGHSGELRLAHRRRALEQDRAVRLGDGGGSTRRRRSSTGSTSRASTRATSYASSRRTAPPAGSTSTATATSRRERSTRSRPRSSASRSSGQTLRRRIEGQQRHLRRRRRVSAEPQHRRQGGDRVLRHRVRRIRTSTGRTRRSPCCTSAARRAPSSTQERTALRACGATSATGASSWRVLDLAQPHAVGVTSTHSSSRMNSSAWSSDSAPRRDERTSSSALAERMFVSFFSFAALTSRSSARALSPTIMPS